MACWLKEYKRKSRVSFIKYLLSVWLISLLPLWRHAFQLPQILYHNYSMECKQDYNIMQKISSIQVIDDRISLLVLSLLSNVTWTINLLDQRPNHPSKIFHFCLTSLHCSPLPQVYKPKCADLSFWNFSPNGRCSWSLHTMGWHLSPIF